MSELKLFSLGIVLEDKIQEDDYIVVTPIEHLSMQNNGDLSKQISSVKGDIPSLTNDGNQSFTTEHLVTNKIKAKWISFGVSNRETAPDVCRGETVILFQYGNVDEYYWTTLFREPLLRKQETVLYTYSNQKSIGSSYDPSTSYWTRIDTRNKKIQWHTSNNDGELTTYDSILDTKNGLYVTFQDGHNNFSVLNSKENTYQLNVLENIRINDKENTDYININYKNNTITIGAGKMIALLAGDTIYARSLYLDEEYNQIKTIVHDLYYIETKTLTIKAEKVIIDSPAVEFTGDVSIKGNFTIEGNINFKNGQSTINGDLIINGGINASDDINAPNLKD